jgi:hypothetical protein
VGYDQHYWVNKSIADAYVRGLSVFIFMHQKMPGTFSGSEDHATMTGAVISDILSYWNSKGKPVSLYACGHSHDSCLGTNAWHETRYGGTHLLIGTLAYYFAGGQRHDPCSRYLYFTEGSTTVLVRSFNHTGNSFKKSNDFTFNLLYKWDDGVEPHPSSDECAVLESGEEPVGFESIAGSSNLVFSWVKVSAASSYGLRIATDNSFSQVKVNLSGICNANYPEYFYENETRAFFVLPSQYIVLLDSTDYYYVDVTWS